MERQTERQKTQTENTDRWLDQNGPLFKLTKQGLT